MSTYALAISAHPDDVELACGGTIRTLTNQGHEVVLLDCTRGELGTRGTPELRTQEAQRAADILGVRHRECLGMPDGAVEHTQANILAVVAAIRAWRPHILLIPPPVERHPDHVAVHRLCTAATFLAGLTKVVTHRDGVEQLPFRPTRTLCFQQQYDFPRLPDLYVDISSTFQAKMDSILAYRSQFHSPDAHTSDEPETFISRPAFITELEARARYYGSRIGADYAEGFLAVEPLAVASLADLR
jgi:bacillithiol biosynthesis deacetylase BshB1